MLLFVDIHEDSRGTARAENHPKLIKFREVEVVPAGKRSVYQLRKQSGTCIKKEYLIV